jgi:hypothetical protein
MIASIISNNTIHPNKEDSHSPKQPMESILSNIQIRNRTGWSTMSVMEVEGISTLHPTKEETASPSDGETKLDSNLSKV